MMPPGNPRSGEDMLISNFKNRYSALIQLQIDDIPDDLMQRQGTNLIIGPLSHQFHSLSELRYAELHSIETNGLNADLKPARQFLIRNKRIIFDHTDELLLSGSFWQTFYGYPSLM
ncbi:hypothetical protein D3C73_1141490 [compost metagenome]